MIFGRRSASITSKPKDSGLTRMLEQRKFSVVMEVLMQDPVLAKELIGQDGFLFNLLAYEPPVDLLTVVVGILDEKSLMARNEQGQVPLHAAVIQGCKADAVNVLLNKKTAMVRDDKGRVPLHYAVNGKASHDVIKKLVRVAPGALDEEDNIGSTPRELAVGQVDAKTLDLFNDPSLSQTSIRRNTSSAGLSEESDRSKRSQRSGGRHRSIKKDGGSGDFSKHSGGSKEFSSRRGSKELSKKGSKEFSKNGSKEFKPTIRRSNSHDGSLYELPKRPSKTDSLEKSLEKLAPSRSKSFDNGIPVEVVPGLNYDDDDLSTIGGWNDKPALPLTGVEFVERLARKGNVC